MPHRKSGNSLSHKNDKHKPSRDKSAMNVDHKTSTNRSFTKFIPDVQNSMKHMIGITDDNVIVDLNVEKGTFDLIPSYHVAHNAFSKLVSEREDIRSGIKSNEHKLFQQALADLRALDCPSFMCDDW